MMYILFVPENLVEIVTVVVHVKYDLFRCEFCVVLFSIVLFCLCRQYLFNK